MAICPEGALALAIMPPERCEGVQRELFPSAAQLTHYMRARRSIRAYEQRPVPRETLAAPLDPARYAPMGSNSQTVRWLVLYDSAKVKELAAPAYGLGACWGGYIMGAARGWAPTREVLGLAEEGENPAVRLSALCLCAHPAAQRGRGYLAITKPSRKLHAYGRGTQKVSGRL